MNSTSRRNFLQQATGVCAGLCAGIPASSKAAKAKKAKEVPELEIVDTHQHLWDLSKLRLPWLKDVKPLARSYVMKDYLAATSGLGVTKSVYMEVDVDPAQHDDEVAYVVDLCRRDDNPMCGAVIGGRPGEESFAAYIRKHSKHSAVKGVRQVLHVPGTPAGHCLRDTFVESIRLLGELGLSFDICIRPGELKDAAKLVDACRDTQFILDHCGNISSKTKDRTTWQRDIEALAQRNNLVCKISGQIDKAPERWGADDLAPIINHCLDTFGPDRVVYGGDWPVCTLGGTYRQWVEALREIIAERPREQNQKLLSTNALRVYRLS